MPGGPVASLPAAPLFTTARAPSEPWNDPRTQEDGGAATARRARLAKLAEQIRHLGARTSSSLPRCPSGLAPLDTALGGGFLRGAIHEFLAPGGSAAACSVALLTATRAAQSHRWIFYVDTAQDFYPPGAAQLGVPLQRLLVIRVPCRADALWVCEQSLRCSAVAAIICPLRGLDAYTSRRLQLAAETGGSLGLFLRYDAKGGPTFSASRLCFDAQRGPGPGRRLRVSVLKLREGTPGEPFEIYLPPSNSERDRSPISDSAHPAPRYGPTWARAADSA